MKIAPKNLSIVIPAFNEGDTISSVVEQLKEAFPESCIIVVDDASRDDTYSLARKAGADLALRHRKNSGYGASIKTGVRAASTDYVATFDGDGQHRPDQLKRLLESLNDEDIVIGARKSGKQQKRRVFLKSILFGFCNLLAGEKIPDVNSGLRIFRKADFMEYEYMFPDSFSLSTTSTLAFLRDPEKKVKFVPIRIYTRGGGVSTVSALKHGYFTFLLILKLSVMFDPMRIFTPVALFLILCGAIYGGIWTIATRNLPDGSIFLMLFGFIIFVMGLLAEQICSIRKFLHRMYRGHDNR